MEVKQEHLNEIYQLSYADQCEYSMLSKNVKKYLYRGSICKNFASFLNDIKCFIAKEDGREKERSVACGILFINKNKILTNIKRFSKLFGKTSSTINSSFLAIGFETIPINEEALKALIDLDYKCIDYSEARKWTLKIRIPKKLRKGVPWSSQHKKR